MFGSWGVRTASTNGWMEGHCSWGQLLQVPPQVAFIVSSFLLLSASCASCMDWWKCAALFFSFIIIFFIFYNWRESLLYISISFELRLKKQIISIKVKFRIWCCRSASLFNCGYTYVHEKDNKCISKAL